MKLLTLLFITGIFFLFGAEHFEDEIIQLIEEVKKAPPEERYEVMNKLKLKLREMNRTEREEIIRKIYRELKSPGHQREYEHEIEKGKRVSREVGEKMEKMKFNKGESVLEKMEDLEEKKGKDEHIDGDDIREHRGRDRPIGRGILK